MKEMNMRGEVSETRPGGTVAFRLGAPVALEAALALAGCGGSGPGATGAASGDGDSEMSLLAKWQRFEEGAPTLRMKDAQVSEAWRSAAGKSTHRVVRAGPSSVGNDPGSGAGNGSEPAMTEETWPDFPVEAVACAPGECDLDSPRNGISAYAAVLEHDGVPVAELRSRFTVTEFPERETGGGRTDRFESLTYGGWLDHAHFNVTVSRWCTAGSPGCAGRDDPDALRAGGSVHGYMAGVHSGTTPTGPGPARWTGVMVGMEDLSSDSLRRERPDVFIGDATVVIEDLAAPDVDVAFTNIHNVTKGIRHRDMDWQDLPVEDGLFGRVSQEGDGARQDHLVGMFAGPAQQEAGGEFRRDGIAGAFGAKRR